jgi:ribonuclease inhibitor
MAQERDERRAVVRVDVADVKSIAELHERLAAALGFPDFYGKNWDAFWDAITGLVDMPRRLVVCGWRNVVTRWPGDAEMMLRCLRELNQRFPSWGCEVEVRDGAATEERW